MNLPDGTAARAAAPYARRNPYMNGFLTLLALPLVLSLSACLGEGEGSSPPSSPTASGSFAPSSLSTIMADDALLLAQSTLDAIGKLAAIGEVTQEMIRRGAPLLGGDFTPNAPDAIVDLPECNAAIEPGPGENRLGYAFYQGGFDVPAGPALRAEFAQCTVANLLIDGTLHIADVSFSGDIASAVSDWSFAATVVMGPIEIHNADGSLSTYTDEFRYTAVRTGGVLRVDMEVAAEPGAGIVGGVNAQHHREQVFDNNSAVNYQFRPFAITSVDDADSGEYTLAIRAHGTDGASRLERYTNVPASTIQLTIANTADIVWQSKPENHGETPSAGAIVLSTGADNILVTVAAGGAVLTVNDGGAVNTQMVDWDTLLTTPMPWN